MSDMEHSDLDLIDQFIYITDEKPECAEYYLKMGDWNLDYALEFFYESDDEILSSKMEDQTNSKSSNAYYTSNIQDNALVKVTIDEPAKKQKKKKKKLKLRHASNVVDYSYVPQEVLLDNGVVNTTAARAEVPLVPGDPTTTLTIKLVDGTRIRDIFNHSHTIADIRRYIIAARSFFAINPFQLQSSHPSKILNNNTQTLLDAGLLDTMVFQVMDPSF